jgi:hypothetical protein
VALLAPRRPKSPTSGQAPVGVGVRSAKPGDDEARGHRGDGRPIGRSHANCRAVDKPARRVTEKLGGRFLTADEFAAVSDGFGKSRYAEAVEYLEMNLRHILDAAAFGDPDVSESDDEAPARR